VIPVQFLDDTPKLFVVSIQYVLCPAEILMVGAHLRSGEITKSIE
jgi:hypothetical protein